MLHDEVHYLLRSDLRYLLCHVLAPQTELNDGIAMMVGNNDRMQGIISQLEETCRAIEVSVQLLQRLAAHSRSKRMLCARTNAPALTCRDIQTHVMCPCHRHSLCFYLSVGFRQRDGERRINV